MPAKLGHEDTLHAGRTTQYTMYCTVYAETCSTTPYTRSVQKDVHFHTRTVLQIAFKTSFLQDNLEQYTSKQVLKKYGPGDHILRRCSCKHSTSTGHC